jgi:hypothetical protein
LQRGAFLGSFAVARCFFHVPAVRMHNVQKPLLTGVGKAEARHVTRARLLSM